MKHLGMSLAEASLFMNIASIPANFIISKRVGPDGQEVEPRAARSTEFTTVYVQMSEHRAGD